MTRSAKQPARPGGGRLVRVRSRDGIDVPARWHRPRDARAVLALAHGAGAGMDHPFMVALARELARRRVAVLRYAFPYTAAGRRRPDPPRTLMRTVDAAVSYAARLARGLPVAAGGKSMGGRMTSRCIAEGGATAARAVVFVGFPLHAPGRAPDDARAAHLSDVDRPMLFVQGTRDRLADLDAIRRVVRRLRPRAMLHVIDGADHGFAVPRRSGRSADDVMREIADVVARFVVGACAS